MTGGDYVLETRAVFRRKDTQIETTDCVIDKVIRLSGAMFDSFSRNLLRDWAFIRDNPIDTVVDAEGRYHCLLVVGDGRRDGILVNPEGSGYARYSSFIPNAEDFLTLGRYPALAALNQKLTGIVDHIAGQAEERAAVDLLELETEYGIDLMRNGALLHTVLGMLDEKPEISDYEFDKNMLILHREPESIEKAGMRAADDYVTVALDSAAPEERPSVLKQIRDAKQAPRPPRKEKAPGRQRGDAER